MKNVVLNKIPSGSIVGYQSGSYPPGVHVIARVNHVVGPYYDMVNVCGREPSPNIKTLFNTTVVVLFDRNDKERAADHLHSIARSMTTPTYASIYVDFYMKGKSLRFLFADYPDVLDICLAAFTLTSST